jgi:hypothetical protein
MRITAVVEVEAQLSTFICATISLLAILLAFVHPGLVEPLTTSRFLSDTDILRPSPYSGSAPDVVLEVSATRSTMESDYTYLYLRVFSDSTGECQPCKPANAEKAATRTIKKPLSEDEFKRIRSILDEPKLLNLNARYETKYAVLDSWTEWNIKFEIHGQSRSVAVLSFSPGLARTMKHPYPEALTKLGCTIEKLRSDVSGESATLDGECKKVLGFR